MEVELAAAQVLGGHAIQERRGGEDVAVVVHGDVRGLENFLEESACRECGEPPVVSPGVDVVGSADLGNARDGDDCRSTRLEDAVNGPDRCLDVVDR
jgi:hypothetical protein